MQPLALPGFSAKQTASLQAFISAQVAVSKRDFQPLLDEMNDNPNALNAAAGKHFGLQQATQATRHSTQLAPLAPQEAKKEEEKEKQEPLQQLR